MIEIPMQWVGPLAFATLVAVFGWLVKGKAERWDAAADRSQHHDARITALEQAAKPPRSKS